VSVFKKLNRNDITITPYTINKEWNWNWSDYDYFLNDPNIEKRLGVNHTGSWDSFEFSWKLKQFLNYQFINHSFYQRYTSSLSTGSLASSNYYESASIYRSTGSYLKYENNPYFVNNFPSSSNDFINYYQINQNIFGNNIVPGTFLTKTFSNTYEFYDDAAGNIIAKPPGNEDYVKFDYVTFNYVVGNAQNYYYVGNIFYPLGIIVINKEWEDEFRPTQMTFKNEFNIYENIVKCTIKENEFNTSYNPSLKQNRFSQTSSLQNFATGSEFSPYATTIGLYNDNNELLMVAKLSQPAPISQNNEITFLIRYDV